MSDNSSQAGVTAPDPSTFVPGDSRPRARVTVVERVYYECLDPPGQVVDIGAEGFSVPLFDPADDQCVPGRIQTVGTDWAPLDLLYLRDMPVSVLVVDNLEGTYRQRNPTPAELAATASKVVELGVVGPADANGVPVTIKFAVVRPARTVRLEPAGTVYARCSGGPAKVRVAAAPGEKED